VLVDTSFGRVIAVRAMGGGGEVTPSYHSETRSSGAGWLMKRLPDVVQEPFKCYPGGPKHLPLRLGNLDEALTDIHKEMNKLAASQDDCLFGLPTAPQEFKVPAVRPPGKKDDYFDPWENPLRDYVNFPREEINEWCPATRHGWAPETYFKQMEEVTGVTGPYVLPAGIVTFLFSKEILMHEHFTVLMGTLWIFFYCIMRTLAKKIIEAEQTIQADHAEQSRLIIQYRKDYHNYEIEEEKLEQYNNSSFEDLIASKREAVELQLETEYRKRVEASHAMVKKKLDYQVELQTVLKRAEQKHMVDWIITNVRKSITAKQEDEALRKCIADLKAMAKK